jgi:hypothetical protein
MCLCGEIQAQRDQPIPRDIVVPVVVMIGARAHAVDPAGEALDRLDAGDLLDEPKQSLVVEQERQDGKRETPISDQFFRDSGVDEWTEVAFGEVLQNLAQQAGFKKLRQAKPALLIERRSQVCEVLRRAEPQRLLFRELEHRDYRLTESVSPKHPRAEACRSSGYTAVVPVSSSVVVNPHVELTAVKDAGTVASITVRAPVKGSGLRVTTIDKSEPQTLGTLLVHLITGEAPLNVPPAEQQRLRDIGFFVTPEQTSDSVWYSCDVLDPPRDLVPRRMRKSLGPPSEPGDLIVNPTLAQLGTDGPTASMRGRIKLRNRFRPDRSWLWLQEPDMRAPGLYSFVQGDRHLTSLAAGAPVPADIDGATRRQLLAAGVLESASEADQRRKEREHRVAQARRELHDQRYTTLRHVIAPLQIAAARRYYRDAISEGYLVPGDAEWPNRPFSSRDPIGNFFHTQMNGLISEIAGTPLKPSFSFFASYRTGAELPPHRDRDQCEYAMSILVDFSPEPDDQSPWPIFVQPPGAPSATPVPLGIGDAVLYYGREVRHHREILTQAEYCSCWFCFYVAQDFDGPLD